MQTATKTDDEIVRLRVGGRPFHVQRSLLCQNRDSMLGAMFCGLHYLTTNDDGEHELPDRDPDLFELLLDAMCRNGGLLNLDAIAPEWFENQHALGFLVDEFAFFGVQSVLCQLHVKLSGLLDGDLLNSEQGATILSWLNEGGEPVSSSSDLSANNAERWRLGYKASRDGFSSMRFHELCDHFAETIVVIKIRGNGFLYGGYTDRSWGGGGDRLCFNEKKSSTKSFLFSLVNNAGAAPCRMDINLQLNPSGNSAILCSPFWGPTFGAAQSDLWLADDMRGGQAETTTPLPLLSGRPSHQQLVLGEHVCLQVTTIWATRTSSLPA